MPSGDYAVWVTANQSTVGDHFHADLLLRSSSGDQIFGSADSIGSSDGGSPDGGSPNDIRATIAGPGGGKCGDALVLRITFVSGPDVVAEIGATLSIP